MLQRSLDSPQLEHDLSEIGDDTMKYVCSDNSLSNSNYCDQNSANCGALEKVAPPIMSDLQRLQSTYSRNVVCAHLNINGLRSKRDEIRYIMSQNYFDVLCLSECKLDVSDNDSIFVIEGFSLTRRDKRKTSGGLLVYISNRIPHREVALNTDSSNVEMLSIELTFDTNDTWLLVHAYKNPMIPNTLFE